MSLKPRSYYLASFLVAATSCLAFVLSAFQLYSNEDYVHNYLGCGPDADTGAIPIMRSLLLSVFFFVVHAVAHLVLYRRTLAKTKDKPINLRFGFYQHDKAIVWVIKLLLYTFAVFLGYNYVSNFYKFYVFEFFSFIVMTITVLLYASSLSFIADTTKE